MNAKVNIGSISAKLKVDVDEATGVTGTADHVEVLESQMLRSEKVAEDAAAYKRKVLAKYSKFGKMKNGNLVWSGDHEKVAVPEQEYIFHLHNTPVVYSFCKLTDLAQLADVVPRSGPKQVLERLEKDKVARVVAAAAAAAAKEEGVTTEASRAKLGEETEKKDLTAHDSAIQAKSLDTVVESIATAGQQMARLKNRNRKKAVELEIATALRLDNNELSNLKRLEQSIAPIVSRPNMLCWLDLSFNKLTKLEPIVEACPGLKVLYLHVNLVSDVKEVDSLGDLTELTTLTLQGNPLEDSLKPSYRYRVAAAVGPTLRKLDFSSLTVIEKDKARVWIETPRNKRTLTPRKQRTGSVTTGTPRKLFDNSRRGSPRSARGRRASPQR